MLRRLRRFVVVCLISGRMNSAPWVMGLANRPMTYQCGHDDA